MRTGGIILVIREDSKSKGGDPVRKQVCRPEDEADPSGFVPLPEAPREDEDDLQA